MTAERDIIERLRVGPSASYTPGQHFTKYQDLCNEAAGEIERRRSEIERLEKRLDLLAVGFGVPDGGKFIADWQTRIARFNSLTAREQVLVGALENARRDILALKSRSDTGSLRSRQIESSALKIETAINESRKP